MEDCRHYKKCPEIEKDLMELMFSEKSQEASTKSLHKRQDKADKMREDLTLKVETIIITVHDLDSTLKTHMEWEEQMDIINKVNKDKNISIMKWISGFVIIGLLSSIGYAVDVIHKTEKSSIHNSLKLNNVEASLVEIKKLIIDKE